MYQFVFLAYNSQVQPCEGFYSRYFIFINATFARFLRLAHIILWEQNCPWLCIQSVHQFLRDAGFDPPGILRVNKIADDGVQPGSIPGGGTWRRHAFPGACGLTERSFDILLFFELVQFSFCIAHGSCPLSINQNRLASGLEMDARRFPIWINLSKGHLSFYGRRTLSPELGPDGTPREGGSSGCVRRSSSRSWGGRVASINASDCGRGFCTGLAR